MSTMLCISKQDIQYRDGWRTEMEDKPAQRTLLDLRLQESVNNIVSACSVVVKVDAVTRIGLHIGQEIAR